MSEEELHRYRREIDWVKDFPGADTERNLIRIAIAKQDLTLLSALTHNYVFDESTSKWVPLTKTSAEGYSSNISKFGGTTVTGRDIAKDLQKLQNLDISLTELRNALRGTGGKDFTTLESDTESILNQLDIKLTELRDALRGSDMKNFTTLESQFIPDSSGLPKIFKDFHYKAVDITIDSGDTWYIEPGEVLACLSMTNNGRIWNDGTVFAIDGVYDGGGVYDGNGIYK